MQYEYCTVLGDTDDSTILDDTKISQYSQYDVTILWWYRK